MVADDTGGGDVKLGGRVTVIVTGTYSSLPRDFTLLHADASLDGTTFDSESISAPGCIAAEIDYDYDNNNVNLHLSSSCD